MISERTGLDAVMLAALESAEELGALVVDSATMTATLRGTRLALTTHEFALLRVLAERAGRVKRWTPKNRATVA